MNRSLEPKIETLIQQLKILQHGNTANTEKIKTSEYENLIDTAMQMKEVYLKRQRKEKDLLFAYRTLEVGYQRYWDFYNFAPDGYLVTDTSGIIEEVNQTFLAMVGLSTKDLLYQPINSIIPELNNREFGVQLNWFSGSQQLEVILQPTNGYPIFTSIHIAPQYNAENQPVGLLWLIRDITQLKKTEEELRKSKAELNLILEKIPCILWTTDTSLILKSISGKEVSLMGMSQHDLIGKNVTHIPAITSHQVLAEIHQKVLEGNSETFDIEINNRSFHGTAEPLKDHNGCIKGVIVAAFDITERRTAERVLRKSEGFNSALLKNAPNPIYVTQADSSITYANPAFARLFGLSASKLIGLKAPYPWWKDKSAEYVSDFKNSLGKKGKKVERSFINSKGEEFWVEATSIRIRNSGEPDLYLQTWVNITEAKRLRENMEFYMIQITKAQEEERKRIAQELHEETLQSLAALCLATESIIRLKNNNSEDTEASLEQLQMKINGVIEKVRGFSHGLRPGVLDYLGLSAALESLADELQDRGIKTRLSITGQEIPLSPDKEIIFFRIAQEAVNNIRKYSQATEVSISLKYAESKISLNIKDNGLGFELPQRLNEYAKQNKLGIIGMKEKARLYGGSFLIKSLSGKGTRVTVSLPVIE
jgi:PAS domain S-box-containing protein